MSGANSKVDLVAVSGELSSSYVALGRLALARPVESDLVLCQIQNLSEIFDNQLLCSVCRLSSVPKLFHSPDEGILCEECHNKKLFEPSSSAKQV